MVADRLFDSDGGGATDGDEDTRGPLQAGPAAPLAARMRPRNFEEFVGQTDVVGEGTQLRRLLERDELPSLILWGPPGSGKTSMAAVVAATTDAAWSQLSAVNAGVRDMRTAIEEGRSRLDAVGRATVLFVDEIHRFNKAQQDALLPAVESGVVVLIGATTENPYFELNAPLLSRCRLVRLETLESEDLAIIIRRALADPDRGYGGRVDVTDQALDYLVDTADGDARVALSALEAAVDATTDQTADGPRQTVTRDEVADALASKQWRYDKAGDAHYDEISAFIKSLRGSDPDAAVYWLVRMLAAGEDPRFLARRMIIFASEDVGLADRRGLATAVAAFQALDRVGLPEARYNLVHAALALATAPKSNSVARTLSAADEAVAEAGNAAVPPHLRDAHYRGADELGHGRGYAHPHDYAGGYVAQQYLPDEVAGHELYTPSHYGDEREVADRVAGWRHATAADQADDIGETDDSDDEGETA